LKRTFTTIAILLACAVGKAQPSEGKASFYSNKFKGRSTASGEKYNPDKLTAAHRSLPFGTCVKITNLVNDSSTIVRINDRGPFIKGRIIDVSMAAAQQLNFVLRGITKVKIEMADTSIMKTDTIKSN
jgi:rare lipoprotein A